MNFLTAFHFLSLPTYSFQLQYLFIVGSLPQSITRDIPKETEYNQISKQIKPIKPKVIFLLSKLGPFSPIHPRLHVSGACEVRCKGQCMTFCGISYRVVCTLQKQVVFLPFRNVFMSVNIPRRHVSYRHEQVRRMNTSGNIRFDLSL